jgi:lipoate-protein ligase A
MSEDGSQKIAGAAMKRTRSGVLIQGTMDRTLLSSFDEKNFFSTFIEEISALVDEQPDYLAWPEEFSKGRVPFVRQFSSLSWLRDRSLS